MTYDIRFEIVRNANGEVIGFALYAGPQAQAERYVNTLPAALSNHEAEITLGRNTIVFGHPNCPQYGCNQEFDADQEELDALSLILRQLRGPLTIIQEGLDHVGPCFKLILISEMELVECAAE